MSMITEFESKLLGLLNKPGMNILIDYNYCTSFYRTVAEAVEEGDIDEDSWVSPEEKALAIELNSVWRLTWYPDTPVGFYSVSASSLEAAMLAALKVKA